MSENFIEFDNAFKFKVLSGDLLQINDFCGNKCIYNYQKNNLNDSESYCLQKCFIKNFEISNYVLKEFVNLSNKLD